MLLWWRRWQVNGMFCVLYSDTDAFCEMLGRGRPQPHEPGPVLNVQLQGRLLPHQPGFRLGQPPVETPRHSRAPHPQVPIITAASVQ